MDPAGSTAAGAHVRAAIEPLRVAFGLVTNAVEQILDDGEKNTRAEELEAWERKASSLKTTSVSLDMIVNMTEGTRTGHDIKTPIVDLEKASFRDEEDQEEKDPWAPLWLYLKVLVFWVLLGVFVCYVMPLLVCLESAIPTSIYHGSGLGINA
ncbi:hypothetical protein PG993_008317 [Apiospora rasikravindrae]|uniref:Uncharacterized protein n=1 Tax=Apiospora rasikravindrae TaxID=990691 RepID=A0ABR1T1F7_9PEZI